ncbi:MAG: NADH-quinone oxidoreductase subunit H [Dehalobacter sp. 4CP]|jgi:formate hydrogenlyase subunit 4|uniref:NADH-quinone oxidoreductase subunit H n=2 Tax=Dehalobacter restrictus TaxID=55583 RepID=A0A857DJA5_9FIRM|nr:MULTISPECIES: complex I subunit 1 family protein [Dehalobacter]NBJ16385.1 NADH-quinone oxidoreductase subunit H [Dehalobacter sp. 4CP]AHF10087.1 ech hydrogenase subunit B [Dehalobacter restrictus DSM 9455]MCG1025301.1 NADH-quinone oxidoreductase subunit H [Dehalobacter sp.]MDJ0306170.1 NADH-quinone oxidoreductase subunit H [Dehalobacter sp.]OCZ51990.1 Ech hydrogenase subunit EchB [Dehalobacter sp. TeCB1]
MSGNYAWLMVILYIILAPFIGGLIAGVDRRISARMQSRYGPPILQPFYDIFKLMNKSSIAVNPQQRLYIICFIVFVIISGAIFFGGGDLLLAIFALTLASIFLIIAAYSTFSPYAYIGAEREMLQIMAYEPMVILTTVGMYMVTKSFNVWDIAMYDQPLLYSLPGIFLGFLFILTIKFRKSPFDISMSHHAHQEIVRGIITEFSGTDLALIEIAHWYENVFLLGIVCLFFASSPIIALILAIVVYFLEIWIDNNYSRLKWQSVLGSAWIVALVLGVGNIAYLALR